MILDGRPVADNLAVSTATTGLAVDGLAVPMAIFGSAATQDQLQVRGLGGDDTIRAAAGAEAEIGIVLDGGDGNDYLEADATLLDGGGDDTIVPLAGSNVIDGGDGFDTILMPGSAGNDTINIKGPAANMVISQSAGGATSTSTNVVMNIELVRVAGQDGDDMITLVGLTIAAVVEGGPGNDIVNAAGVTAANVTLLGGDGDDALTGGSLADRIEGGTGNDTMTGGPGADLLLGGDDSDRFNWNDGDGSDRIEGGAGSNSLAVKGRDGAGDDFIIMPNGARLVVARTNLTTFGLDAAEIQELDLNG